MPTAAQIAENKFMTLDRLLLGGRIVWQRQSGSTFPESVWWDKQPQLGRPTLWLSTCKAMLRQGLIIEGMRPKDSNYSGSKSVALYVATPQAETAFVDFAIKTYQQS